MNLPGGPELILIAVAALVILGPDRLPIAARQLGALIRKVRDMTSGVRGEFDSVMAEPVRELRGLANDTRNVVLGAVGDGPNVDAPGSAPPSLAARSDRIAGTSTPPMPGPGPSGSSPHADPPRGQANTVTAPSLIDEGLTIGVGNRQSGPLRNPAPPPVDPHLL